MIDTEKSGSDRLLVNQSVNELTWDVVEVSVPDRNEKSATLNILENVKGSVHNGN